MLSKHVVHGITDPHWTATSHSNLGCAGASSHSGDMGWTQIPLCLPQLHWTEVYIVYTMGTFRPTDWVRGMFASEDAVCRSSKCSWIGFTVPAAGQSDSLLACCWHLRDFGKSAVGLIWLFEICRKMDPQRTPHKSHFMQKWILWVCPFLYPYTAELDLLDSIDMRWKTYLHVCWESDASRT